MLHILRADELLNIVGRRQWNVNTNIQKEKKLKSMTPHRDSTSTTKENMKYKAKLMLTNNRVSVTGIINIPSRRPEAKTGKMKYFMWLQLFLPCTIVGHPVRTVPVV